jgi:hypothetical protein
MAILLVFAVSTQAQTVLPQLLRPTAAGAQPVKPAHAPHNPGSGGLATEQCTYSFTTGSGSTYLNYCITVNGTLVNFQSPAGVEMLDQTTQWEGYGICDNSPATPVSYYDYNYADSGNWNAPVLDKNTSSEVKIARTSSDGLWTLTNTITKEAGPPPYAKVVMALKNNSSVTKLIFLMRYAAMVPDHANSQGNWYENYDASNNSAWGYNSVADSAQNGSDVYGLMLQNVEAPTPSSATIEWYGFPAAYPEGPDPCDPLKQDIGTITYYSGSAALLYIAELTKNQTYTVTDRYFSF